MDVDARVSGKATLAVKPNSTLEATQRQVVAPLRLARAPPGPPTAESVIGKSNTSTAILPTTESVTQRHQVSD